MLTIHAVGPALLAVAARPDVSHKLVSQLHQLLNTCSTNTQRVTYLPPPQGHLRCCAWTVLGSRNGVRSSCFHPAHSPLMPPAAASACTHTTVHWPGLQGVGRRLALTAGSIKLGP